MNLPISLRIPGCQILYSGTFEKAYNRKKVTCIDVRIVKDSGDVTFRIAAADPDFKVIKLISVLDNKMNPVNTMEITASDPSVSTNVALSKALSVMMKQAEKKAASETAINFSWESFKNTLSATLKNPASWVALAGFLGTFLFWKAKAVNWLENKKSELLYEKELNEDLFKNQTGNEPEFRIYSNLINSINMLIDKDTVKSMIVCGLPGTSKTHIVRRTLYFHGLESGKDYIILKGASLSLLDFVSTLYRYKDKIVVLDDFDSPLEDPNVVNILKSATDSYSRRIISVPRATQLDKDGGMDYDLPQKFDFQGKIIVITNKQMQEIDKALISRALSIEVNFSLDEFLKNIKIMLRYIAPEVRMDIKQEVLDFVSKKVSEGVISNINFRTFQNAVSIRLLYPNWQEMVVYALK